MPENELASNISSQTQTAAVSGPLQSLKEALTPTFLPNHYPALHGLRVLAIVLVVQLHATAALHEIRIVSFTTLNLWFGMDLFFFLSGFLIGSMLLPEPTPEQRVNFLRFYARRAFRIVPAYLVVLTVFVWLFPPSAEVRANLWKEYLYLTNYVPPNPGKVLMPWAWSLALEEHFYLIVPALVFLLRALKSPRLQLATLTVLWLSAIPVRCWEYFAHGPWDYMRAMSVLYVRTHLRYDILIAGIFVACVQHHYPAALRRLLLRRAPRLALIGLSLLGFSLLIFTRDIQILWLPYNLLCWGTITSVAYAPLVLWLLNHHSDASRFLSQPLFRQFATFGYGLYLVHVPVVYSLCLPTIHRLGQHIHMPWPLAWSLMVASSLAVSAGFGYLVHVLVEKPALRLRDYLSP